MTSQVPSNIRAIVGANIRAARDAAGMTQRELAVALDVNEMHISRWERGLHRPSDATLTALADVFKVPFHSFFVASEIKEAA